MDNNVPTFQAGDRVRVVDYHSRYDDPPIVHLATFVGWGDGGKWGSSAFIKHEDDVHASVNLRHALLFRETR